MSCHLAAYISCKPRFNSLALTGIILSIGEFVISEMKQDFMNDHLICPKRRRIEPFRVAVNGTLNFARALESRARVFHISNSRSQLSCSHDENAVNTLSAASHLGHWLIIRCWISRDPFSFQSTYSVTNLIFNMSLRELVFSFLLRRWSPKWRIRDS